MSCVIVEERVYPMDDGSRISSLHDHETYTISYADDEESTGKAPMDMAQVNAQWTSDPLSASDERNTNIDDLLLSPIIESVPNSCSSQHTSLFDTPTSSRVSSHGAADRFHDTLSEGSLNSEHKGLAAPQDNGAPPNDESGKPLTLELTRVRSTTWYIGISSAPSYIIEYNKHGQLMVRKPSGYNDSVSPNMFKINHEQIQTKEHIGNPFERTDVKWNGNTKGKRVAQSSLNQNKFRIARKTTGLDDEARPSNLPLVYSIYHHEVSGHFPSITELATQQRFIPHLKLVVASTDIVISKVATVEDTLSSTQDSLTAMDFLVRLDFNTLSLLINTDAIKAIFSDSNAADALVACAWVIAFYDSGTNKTLNRMSHPLDCSDADQFAGPMHVVVPPGSSPKTALDAIKTLKIPPRSGAQHIKPSSSHSRSPDSPGWDIPSASSLYRNISTSFNSLPRFDPSVRDQQQQQQQQQRQQQQLEEEKEQGEQPQSGDSSATMQNTNGTDDSFGITGKKRRVFKRLLTRRRQQVCHAKMEDDVHGARPCTTVETAPKLRRALKQALQRAAKWLVRS